jgi:hypothetical protein
MQYVLLPYGIDHRFDRMVRLSGARLSALGTMFSMALLRSSGRPCIVAEPRSSPSDFSLMRLRLEIGVADNIPHEIPHIDFLFHGALITDFEARKR